MRLMERLAACVSATIMLALIEACGAGVEPQPAPKTAEPSYRAYAYSDIPGTLRAFDVSTQTGALEFKAEVTPDGEPSAPVSSPGSFVVDPEGAFLFHSFDSCTNGGCSNLASYAIGTGGGLTRVWQVGPAPMEGGYTLLA